MRVTITAKYRYSKTKSEGSEMRIYEGDYAYEIEAAIDPVTRVGTGWRYHVYRVRPLEQLLSSGSAGNRQEAERAGEQALAEVRKAEAREPEQPRKSAA